MSAIDPAVVAKGLSEAQRRALIDAFDDGDGGRILYFDTNAHTAYAIHRRRLADDFFHLTPLGLAVRTLLQETNHGD